MMDQPIHWRKHLFLQLGAVTREAQKRHGELNALRARFQNRPKTCLPINCSR